jgi:hypothetical protein
MNKSLKWVIGIVVGGAALAFLVWASIAGRQEAASEAKRERPIESPSRVSIQNGEATIQMDPDAQSRNGIAVSPLQWTSRRQEYRANAVVLTVQELIDLRNSYVSARSQLEKAQAGLDVSRRAYERVKALYEDEQNASAKAVQAAEGTVRSDEITLKAAQDSVHLAENNVHQRWGSVIASWLLSGSPEFDHLVRQENFLIQVTLPIGSDIPAPQNASIETAAGRILSAKLVGPLPWLDPRIQAPVFVYVTPRHSDLIPGMSLLALLPAGVSARGVVIPRLAVVWWQGKAWAYVQVAPDKFVRREVLTEMPVEKGWFVTKNFVSEQRVVVSGPQQLLSEEFRSQIQVGGEETK